MIQQDQLLVPRPPIYRVLYPITAFLRTEAAGGIILIVSALFALLWANSPWAETYQRFWDVHVTLGPLTESLTQWINDGLMAIFFFVVGLEIKREVLVGELASPRQAALPILAAVGGMVVPAAIYALVNRGGAGAHGWGVPMATDIAFALGVLALLGSRIPTGLKVFLAALAIVDDLGAVLVIAIFYTTDVAWLQLALAALLVLLLVTANLLHLRHPLIYAVLGFALWLAVFHSGIHATIAGVVLALTIPARTRVDTGSFYQRATAVLDEFEQAGEEDTDILTNGAQQAAVHELTHLCEAVQTPLQRLEHALHPWVALLIVPLFALANAGVDLRGDFGHLLLEPVTLGVILGLVVGKQVGILTFSWLAVRSGLADLPEEVGWRQIYGVGWLGGIGFTMALFIGSLAYGSAELLAAAKVGILAASLLAGTVGWLILRLLPTSRQAAQIEIAGAAPSGSPGS